MRPEEGRSHVERECGRCFDGVVHVGGPTEVKTAPCANCHRTGKVLAYLYPKPKGRRGPWPPEGVAGEGRCGEDVQGEPRKTEAAEREDHREG